MVAWRDATCAHCGCNIYGGGGDPDWGLCYDCKCRQHDETLAERKHYEEMARQDYDAQATDYFRHASREQIDPKDDTHD